MTRGFKPNAGHNRVSAMETATEKLGGGDAAKVPDWIMVLARQCDDTSRHSVAELLGCRRERLSEVFHGTAGEDLDGLARTVREKFAEHFPRQLTSFETVTQTWGDGNFLLLPPQVWALALHCDMYRVDYVTKQLGLLEQSIPCLFQNTRRKVFDAVARAAEPPLAPANIQEGSVLWMTSLYWGDEAWLPVPAEVEKLARMCDATSMSEVATQLGLEELHVWMEITNHYSFVLGQYAMSRFAPRDPETNPVFDALVEKAAAGETIPLWRFKLASACDRGGRARVARHLGCGESVVSQLLSGNYRASTAQFEGIVRGWLMGEHVACPARGTPLGANVCVDLQRNSARTNKGWSRDERNFFDTCRRCPQNKVFRK